MRNALLLCFAFIMPLRLLRFSCKPFVTSSLSNACFWFQAKVCTVKRMPHHIRSLMFPVMRRRQSSSYHSCSELADRKALLSLLPVVPDCVFTFPEKHASSHFYWLVGVFYFDICKLVIASFPADIVAFCGITSWT